MNALSDWVRNVVVLVFVISAAQLLLPSDNMRPYVRFILGLVVISFLLTSIFQLSTADIGLEHILFPDSVSDGTTSLIQRGKAIAARAQNVVMEANNERVTSQVTSVASLVLGFEPEQVIISRGEGGTVSRVVIIVPEGIEWSNFQDGQANGYDVGPRQEQAARAARTVAGLLGLEPEQVLFQGPFDQGGWRR